jgi:hypothetical protein
MGEDVVVSSRVQMGRKVGIYPSGQFLDSGWSCGKGIKDLVFALKPVGNQGVQPFHRVWHRISVPWQKAAPVSRA